MPRRMRDIRFPNEASLFLITRAQRPIILEVEVAHRQVSQFVREYSSWTGINTTWDQLVQTTFAMDAGSGKWGTECRIYFVKDQTVKNQLERYGCSVDDGDVRNYGTFRVNSKMLFQQLVERHGLRLGSNM